MPPGDYQYDQEDDDFDAAATDEDVTDEFAEAELKPGQEEIRALFSYGAALGYGVIAPWQIYSVAFMNHRDAWSSDVYSVGGGNFVFTGSYGERSYELTIDSRSFFYGRRFYFTELGPFFFEPLVGYATWEGRSEPTAAGMTGGPEIDKLDVGFHASGPVLGLNFGLHWAWSSGFFLEYSIFRLGRAFVLSKSYTEASEQGRKTVVKNLEQPLSWGYANFRLGWHF